MDKSTNPDIHARGGGPDGGGGGVVVGAVLSIFYVLMIKYLIGNKILFIVCCKIFVLENN